MGIAENLIRLHKEIPSDVRIIAVSKTMPVSAIQEAYDNGQRDFGENKVQEMADKQRQLPGDIAWHMIGHLQTNKAKSAIDLFSLIHSVDRMSLAEELNREAAKKNKILPVLIQVNISGEETKSGIDPAGTRQLLQEVALLPSLSVQGLMTMPPWFENPEEARPYFIALRKLRDELAGEKIPNVSLKELSMGMSGDFETAIEEGATLVRIGTAIFGERG